MDLLDNVEDIDQEKVVAEIKYFGYNSNKFGTAESGSLIGTSVEILHLYPVACNGKTDLSYDHAIVQIPGKPKSDLLNDVKFENIRVV